MRYSNGVLGDVVNRVSGGRQWLSTNPKAQTGADIWANAEAIPVISQGGASPSERHAAIELADALTRITGKTHHVTMDATVAPEESIIVGPGALATAYFPEYDIPKLGPEELVIRSSGHRLLLSGGRTRGTLYAVFRWLQTQCGVRWWTPWASSYPKLSKVKIGPFEVRQSPAFATRDPFWFHAFNGEWAAHNYANGPNARLTEELGGKVQYAGGFVHTFYSLVPPSRYFGSHPEWYSMIGGKRVSKGAQLCTTNPALRDFIVDRVRELCRANPAATIVSVSQNDNFGPCDCPICSALDRAEGSPAGSMIALANYVGEKIEQEFPNVFIDTLAYQFSRKPPLSIRPRRNVIVRLCTIECSFSNPLDFPVNREFMDDLMGWSRLTQNLYVWDYVTNFSYYLHPQPNYRVIGPNIRLFQLYGVKGVMEQGDYQSNGGEMAELKAWLIAQMLWDPSQDPSALTNEFLAGYFGPQAAGPIREYLDLMAAEASKAGLSINEKPDAGFLRFAVLSKAESLWNEAERATHRNSIFSWRVRMARIPLKTIWLIRWEKLRSEAEAESTPWPLRGTKAQYGAKWLQLIKSSGPPGWTPISQIAEDGLKPEDFLKHVLN